METSALGTFVGAIKDQLSTGVSEAAVPAAVVAGAVTVLFFGWRLFKKLTGAKN